MKNNRYISWSLLVLGFTALALAIYWPASNGSWMFDDETNIIYNFRLRNFSDSFGFLRQTRGIAFFSFALNIQLWGLDPSSFRWVNVVIHTMNSLLVVLLLRQLTGSAWRWAIVGGLFFLCHPVQTSAVSYIVQRMALLSAFFALTAILLVDRYFMLVKEGRRTKAILFFLMSVFCGIFSVMSKENTVLLPLLIPLLAWLRGGGRLAAGWRSAFTFWLSISAVAVVVLFFIGGLTIKELSGGSLSLYKDTGKALYETLKDQDRTLLPIRYFLSQLEVFWVYLGLIFFPLHQALDYSWPIPALRLSLLHLATLVLIAVALWFGYKRRDRYPFLFFGLSWILIFIVVESSIIPLDPIFEHRLYLPLVGVLFIFRDMGALWAKKIAFPVALAAICVLAFMSWKRNLLWGDPVSFWQSNVRVVERAPRPLGKLASSLFAQKRFAEAERETKRLAAIYNIGDMLMGEALFFSGKTDEAMAAFHKAVLHKEPGANGVELFSGYKAIQEKRYGEAADWLNRAELRNANDVKIFYFKGMLAEARNDLLGAVENYANSISAVEMSNDFDLLSFRKCYALWAQERRNLLNDQLSDWIYHESSKVRSSPDNLQIRLDFANQLMQLGLYSEAVEHYEALRRTGQNHWSLYSALAIAYERLGRLEDADKNYEISYELVPNNPEVSLAYAKNLMNRGKISAAYEIVGPLAQQVPNDARVFLLAGDLLRKKGDLKAARDAYLRASLLPGYQEQAIYQLNNLNKMKK